MNSIKNQNQVQLKIGEHLYFKNDIDIELSHDGTSQGELYFGAEKKSGVSVVIKEYTRTNYRDLLREIYILSKIEEKRQKFLADKDTQQIFKTIQTDNDGLPCILGFQLTKDGGEILMADAGLSLGQWFRMLKTKNERLKFAKSLLE